MLKEEIYSFPGFYFPIQSYAQLNWSIFNLTEFPTKYLRVGFCDLKNYGFCRLLHRHLHQNIKLNQPENRSI